MENTAQTPNPQQPDAHDAALSTDDVVNATPGNSLRTQLVRFVSVGVFTAILDFGLTLILTHLGLHRSAAKAIGWVFGTIAAYLANARWTFGAQVSGRTATAVGLLYASTFAVQNFLYWATNAPLIAPKKVRRSWFLKVRLPRVLSALTPSAYVLPLGKEQTQKVSLSE